MNITTLLGKARRFADENSPVILTGMAVTGAFLSSYLTYKGTLKSASMIMNKAMEEAEKGEKYEPTSVEMLMMTWKNYVPAAATLAGTSACMIMATKIGLDRTAAMAGALIVSERTYDQYKEKVKETLGENKHTKIVDAVAKDAVEAAPLSTSIVVGEGEQLCYDSWSGRFFKSTVEDLKQGVNQLNHELIYGAHASLNHFYTRIGLGPVQQGDDIGWNNNHLVELDYTAVLKDNKPCIAITFDREPRPRFQTEGSTIED